MNIFIIFFQSYTFWSNISVLESYKICTKSGLQIFFFFFLSLDRGKIAGILSSWFKSFEQVVEQSLEAHPHRARAQPRGGQSLDEGQIARIIHIYLNLMNRWSSKVWRPILIVLELSHLEDKDPGWRTDCKDYSHLFKSNEQVVEQSLEAHPHRARAQPPGGQSLDEGQIARIIHIYLNLMNRWSSTVFWRLILIVPELSHLEDKDPRTEDRLQGLFTFILI